MTRWEYKWEHNVCLDALNELGKEGWEVVTLRDTGVTMGYLLKRPIPQPSLEHLMRLPARAEPLGRFEVV